ncbi:Archaeal putative transposase ISC1217 [Metallosphaera yellowstonensis MK1]|uniref:Archaeal putative transposase ISC1217 n=1 Tax=Metallosphaera yellowstonensis MK1 TaxID=671065 RepID=H2C7D0_9CREN|nr:Archaeal putative transposase ISC1217 [Metallosphaera yellowstonensis MK1]
MRVTEFKTEIDVAREMLDVLKERFRVSRVVFDSWYWSEKLVTDNVVSELKSNRAQGRVGPGDPRGGGGTPPSGIPPGVYFADLTLGGRAITVKLLVREHKRDSGTQARYLYTTDLSLSEKVEEACRVGDRGHPRDVKALELEDSSFWRRERLQGYLSIFTINNVVRELVGEPNLRSVEAFLMFLNVI